VVVGPKIKGGPWEQAFSSLKQQKKNSVYKKCKDRNPFTRRTRQIKAPEYRSQINTTIRILLSKELREWHYNDWSMQRILLKMR
jgi:hypothetical protein